MATPDEREILKIVEEEGGEAHEVTISNEMGLRLSYVRTIIASMGTRDYIDVSRSGKVTIADKGWRVLGKSPKAPWANCQAEAESPATPRERFERYMAGGANEESSGRPEEMASEITEETSENLEKKTQKASSQSNRMTLEELAAEPSSPEEKFKRYMSK